MPMLKQKELKEILNFIKKGATMDMIAKHYGISTRTLSRKLKDYKKDVRIARAYYQSFIEELFKD